MARVVKPLSATQVKQAKPQEKEYSLYDGKGLSLIVRSSGSKTWMLRYKQPSNLKFNNISLGNYPALSLAEARIKREETNKLVSKGIDPKLHRDKENAKLLDTFEAVAQRWFDIKKTIVSTDYATDIWSSLINHIFPHLGNIPISKIEAPIVIDILKPVANMGTLETVRRLCGRLNEIMTYAVNIGIIHNNPLSGIRAAFQAPIKKQLPALKPEQLPEFLQTLYSTNLKPITRNLILFQLHTMLRPGTVAMAEWNEIDFENKLWKIPADKMKGTTDKKRPFTAVLSDKAMTILEKMKNISGNSKYIFPGDRNKSIHTNKETANAAIRRMGFKGEMVAHGMRTIASTTLNEMGFDSDVIESALSHIDKNEVRSAYNRSEYIDRRRPLMKWWSEHIEQALARGFTNDKKNITSS